MYCCHSRISDNSIKSNFDINTFEGQKIIKIKDSPLIKTITYTAQLIKVEHVQELCHTLKENKFLREPNKGCMVQIKICNQLLQICCYKIDKLSEPLWTMYFE